MTGHAFDARELQATARRICDLRKAYNVREGWCPSDDRLPERFLTTSLEDGPSRGARLPAERLAKMIRSYNRASGFRDDGYPTVATTRALERELSLEGLAVREPGDESRERGS